MTMTFPTITLRMGTEASGPSKIKVEAIGIEANSRWLAGLLRQCYRVPVTYRKVQHFHGLNAFDHWFESPAKALEAYATACSSELPALAADIRKMRVVAVPKRRLMGGWGWKCAVCDRTVLHKDGKTFTDHVCTMRESAANLISKFQGSDCNHAHIVRNSDGKCRCFLCLEELHG